MLRTKLAALAKLGRVNMAPLTMSVSILGAFTLDVPPTPLELLGLGFIGLCAHIFGFGLNDIIDLPLDRTVPERQRHPLATGLLSRRDAWAFVIIQVPLALGAYYLLGGTSLGFSPLGLSIGLRSCKTITSDFGLLLCTGYA